MGLERSWLARHLLATGYLVFAIFFIAGVILGTLVDSDYYWFLGALGFLVLIAILAFGKKWIWVCSKCKREDWRREKHCRHCGGEMQLERATVRVRYCKSGHRIEGDRIEEIEEDRFGITKMCPKCGKILSEGRIEPK